MNNNNEYGKTPFYRTDDGKKEMRISDKESLPEFIAKLRESTADPDAEHIDQIRIIDEETGVTKRIVYPNYTSQENESNPQKNENKRTSSSIGFIIAAVAFMAAVVIFMLFAK